jgi:hypothetical protein
MSVAKTEREANPLKVRGAKVPQANRLAGCLSFSQGAVSAIDARREGDTILEKEGDTRAPTTGQVLTARAARWEEKPTPPYRCAPGQTLPSAAAGAWEKPAGWHCGPAWWQTLLESVALPFRAVSYRRVPMRVAGKVMLMPSMT